MANRQNAVRTLYLNEWENLEEWVDSLDQLARLSDAEISRLFHADISCTAANQNRQG